MPHIIMFGPSSIIYSQLSYTESKSEGEGDEEAQKPKRGAVSEGLRHCLPDRYLISNLFQVQLQT